jgi:hypothetical protein
VGGGLVVTVTLPSGNSHGAPAVDIINSDVVRT